MTPCPIHPEKLRFATVSAAEIEAKRGEMLSGDTHRVYRCDYAVGGCGWYHLTTKPLITKDPGEGK